MEKKLVIRNEFFIREIEGKVTEYYEVLKKIGEGGFSKVYKVKEKETGEIRAMKEVNTLIFIIIIKLYKIFHCINIEIVSLKRYFDYEI